MHEIYKKLEADGVVGPFVKDSSGQLVPRPGWRSEYPKWITLADGKQALVRDVAEEAKLAGALPPPSAPDPLADERAKLAAKSDELDAKLAESERLQAEMKASLAELATARAALQGGQMVSAGSSFRRRESASAGA